MNILIYLIVNGLAVYLASYLLPGVHVRDFFVAITVAVIMGIVNIIIKPVLFLLTLPINILTLGLFTLVINGLMVILVARLVPGFSVDSFFWAVIFSVALSFISSFFNWIRK
jgi:putative membrane protein